MDLLCSKLETNLERMENGLPPLEGWDEWAKHQVPAPPDHAAEIDKALGFVRDENGKVIR